MTISLGLHGVAISLVFALSSSLAQQDKPIVIDFTVMEPSGPPAPPSEVPKKKAETPVIAKVHQIPVQPKQKTAPPQPATETQGTVPVFAKPRESVPTPPEQTTAVAPDGVPGVTGTAVSSRTAGSGGTGNSAEQLSRKYRSEHFAYIKKIIEENLSYPQRAKRLGWTGRVEVSFDVSKNGHVLDIRIVKSSGYELLDSNLVETIRHVEPFPRPPVSVTLKIPITYELR